MYVGNNEVSHETSGTLNKKFETVETRSKHHRNRYQPPPPMTSSTNYIAPSII